MKKFTLNNILFAGFGIIIIFSIIFGIREIKLMNGFISADRKTESATYIIKLTEKLTSVFDDEMTIVNTLTGTESREEISSILKKHSLNSGNFLKYLSQIKNSLTEKTNYDDNEKNLKIIQEISKLYKKETEPLINSMIKSAEKISETENFSDENTKKNILPGLYTNFNETENRISELSEIIYENLEILKKNSDKTYIQTREEKEDYIKAAQLNVFIFITLLIFLSVIIFTVLIKNIFNPLEEVRGYLLQLQTGDLPRDIKPAYGKDVNKLISSLNKITSNLKNAVNFSKDLIQGNFKTSFKPSGEKDILGNTLLKLKENIQKAREEESLRIREEKQRQKTNEGLTMFAEILRRHSDNLQDLADTVISSLVNFLNANQGALFFLNEDNPDEIYYELIGAYAYKRKKYISKKIKPGEGLVGAVALEKYTVYMTEVPEDYIEIESGTGAANPRSVLIVPLKIEENILGIIELASFNKFGKEEIEMTEKIAESIAASLSTAKINMQTAKLNEQFREREELLRQTEKELEKALNEIRKLNAKVTALERENKTIKKIMEE